MLGCKALLSQYSQTDFDMSVTFPLLDFCGVTVLIVKSRLDINMSIFLSAEAYTCQHNLKVFTMRFKFYWNSLWLPYATGPCITFTELKFDSNKTSTFKTMHFRFDVHYTQQFVTNNAAIRIKPLTIEYKNPYSNVYKRPAEVLGLK